jgi:hypothetical protein
MPQPAGSQNDPQGGSAANPLQETLGKLAMFVRQLGMQNTIIQPDMQQASAIFVQALQKVSQAAPGPPQQQSTPGAQ